MIKLFANSLTLCALLAWCATPATAYEEIPQSHAASNHGDDYAGSKLVGSASCTAANCHGGADRARVSLGDPWSPVAYSMWIASDPHAQSYSTLLLAESKRMAAKLGLGAAHEAQTCLACHAAEAAHVDFTVSQRTTPQDGVGCEACHGPAERWLAEHSTAGWMARGVEEKAALGFRNLDNLNMRSQACADCHVGSPGRDVNHDLIAAGHPRLLFEMSGLHARLPKHWRDEREPIETLDAKLWVVGRAAAAAASLELLAHRAANPHAAWPEFAEYDCYACHHSLAEPSWRQENPPERNIAKPGSLRWNEWNYALLSLVRSEDARHGGSSTSDSPLLVDLRKEMTRPSPDRRRVQSLAENTRGEVVVDGSALAAGRFDQYRIADYLRQLSQPELAQNSSWDLAAQRFLGAAAMHYSSVASSGRQQSAPGSSAARRRESLVEIRRLLEFSAADAPGRYNSPQTWDAERRAQLRDAFDTIHAGVDGP